MTDRRFLNPEMIKALREGAMRVPGDDLADSLLYGWTVRLSSHAAAAARQRLALDALGALHGPPPENARHRAWKAAENAVRARAAEERPRAVRIYTEDGEMLWQSGRVPQIPFFPGAPDDPTFASVYMGEVPDRPGGTRMVPTFNDAARAEGAYRCLECGRVVDSPELGSFGPPNCPDDGGAMVKV